MSNIKREVTALAALCEGHSWPCGICESTVGFSRLLEKSVPRAAVIRHQFGVDYSDDILVLLKQSGRSVGTVVLASANFSAQKEARQIALGADCVLRDPVRIDVLVEYLAKFRAPAQRVGALSPAAFFDFGGAHVFPLERRITRHGDSVQVTPREIEFMQTLVRSPGEVVSYQTLYAELLGRNFSGDTVNMRVLLGKTAASLQRVGVNLRDLIHIIPKVGYQFLPKGISGPSGNQIDT